LIESLTPPPEGDLTLAEARAVWPDKLFWSNINVACYELPPRELREEVLRRVEQAAVDGRMLAFEVSEQYPDNWKESLPAVLEALEQTRK
jgi:EAL domain-containing protein (putative c-di-GMP-specific phosphodiesterase class I)